MPLSKAKMRERKRQDRLVVKPMSNLNTTPNVKPTILLPSMLKPAMVGLTDKPVQPTVPIYNPNKQYTPGDRVLVKPLYGRSKKLIEVTIPQVDADGHLIPDY